MTSERTPNTNPPPAGGEGLGVGGTPAAGVLQSPPPSPSPTRGEGSAPSQRHRTGFDATQAWVFDLDNTLYPAECNLFAQVDQRMGEFIASFLGVPFPYARHLQKSYYRQFGTTLSGLMKVHKMRPEPFLDYVHDIDLAVVPEHPELGEAIKALPGRRLIFTNGTRAHAERVAAKLGILHLFEDIYDIVASEYVPKPQAEPYRQFLKLHGVDPKAAAMFEDMPHNLEVPHQLGLTTVLVHSSYVDHPVQIGIRNWQKPPEHVHHMTENLTEFLGDVLSTIATPKSA